MKTSARPEPIESPDAPLLDHRTAPQSSRIQSIARDLRTEGDLVMLAKQMVENAPVAMVALDADTLRVAIANERARALYRDTLGPAAPALLDAMVQRYLPLLNRYGIWDHLCVALQTGLPERSIRLDADALPGHDYPHSFTYDIVPVCTDGKVSTLLITVLDQTGERQQQERGEHAIYAAELRAERMESILDQASDPVLVCDAEGQTVAYNRAALTFATNRLAVERARAHGRRIEPIWDLRRPDHTPLAEIERPAARAMLTGLPIATVELALRRDDGDETPLMVQATPLRDEGGAMTGAIVTLHDISAMKAIERQKDEFIAVASHELRQPLTVIQGQAQMMQRHLRRMMPEIPDEQLARGAEALRKISEGIESQTMRLNTLVSDLLDMSRIQTGQLHLDPVRLSLLPKVRHVVELQRQSTLQHIFTLVERLPADASDPQVMWDPRRIEQILMNLLTNAVKYSPRGGAIGVEVSVLTPAAPSSGTRATPREAERPAAHVVVRDSGIGIPADAMPHLFERFFRAENAVGIQGTGLGLYISRQLARAHGGDLWAESTGLGQGSAFHLTLLLLPPATDATA